MQEDSTSINGVIIVTKNSPGERPYVIWETVQILRPAPSDVAIGCVEFSSLGAIGESSESTVPSVIVVAYRDRGGLSEDQLKWLEARLRQRRSDSGKCRWRFMIHDDKVVVGQVTQLFRALASTDEKACAEFSGYWFHHPVDWVEMSNRALWLMTGCLAQMVGAANTSMAASLFEPRGETNAEVMDLIASAVNMQPADQNVRMFGDIVTSLNIYGKAVGSQNERGVLPPGDGA